MSLEPINPASTQPARRVLRCEHEAMATTFQVYLYNQNPNDAKQACEAAFSEVDLLEKKMSFFLPGSEISQINNLADGDSVIVSAATMACLELSMKVYQESGGAFDPTVGAMLRGRKRWDRADARPENDPAADAVVGMNLIELDSDNRLVRRKKHGVKVDMGSVAKGFAADEMARILDDWGMENSMVIAGQSTMLPTGNPPGEKGWQMRIRDPRDEKTILRQIIISGRAISAASNTLSKHILDPRTWKPVSHTLGAWAAAPSGVWSDALSTAFMVMTPKEVEQYCKDHKEISAMIFTVEGKLISYGKWDDIVL